MADPVVRLVVLTRVVLLVGAPVTLFLVAALRPAAEQGFYFVFANVQAIAVLFEFGVGAMLVQFASQHELGGTTQTCTTTSTCQTTTTFWPRSPALDVGSMSLPSRSSGGDARWIRTLSRRGRPKRDFVLDPLGNAHRRASLLPNDCPVRLRSQGSGHLRRVQGMRLAQAVVATICLWALIPLVGGLTAVATATVINLMIAAGWLVLSFPTFIYPFRAFSRRPPEEAGLHSAQTRAAVNGVVGFLGPQLVAPIVFHYQGAIAAGQVGLSLAAANAPLMLAVSWLQARFPDYGTLVARKEFTRLEETGRRATGEAVLAWGASTAGLLVLLVILQRFSPEIGSRFLPLAPVAALCAVSLAYLLYQAMAGQLRAHREEALLWPMMVGTMASVGATFAGAHRGAAAAAVAHSAAVLGVLLPLSTATFVRRRRLLHTPASVNVSHDDG